MIFTLIFLNLERSRCASVNVQEAFYERFIDVVNVKDWIRKGTKRWLMSFPVDGRLHFETFSKKRILNETNHEVYNVRISKSILNTLEK